MTRQHDFFSRVRPDDVSAPPSAKSHSCPNCMVKTSKDAWSDVKLGHGVKQTHPLHQEAMMSKRTKLSRCVNLYRIGNAISSDQPYVGFLQLLALHPQPETLQALLPLRCSIEDIQAWPAGRVRTSEAFDCWFRASLVLLNVVTRWCLHLSRCPATLVACVQPRRCLERIVDHFLHGLEPKPADRQSDR